MSLKAAGGGEINNKSKSLFFENINNTINFYSELSIRRKKVPVSEMNMEFSLQRPEA